MPKCIGEAELSIIKFKPHSQFFPGKQMIKKDAHRDIKAIAFVRGFKGAFKVYTHPKLNSGKH